MQGMTVRLADRVTPKVPEMTAVLVVTTGAPVTTKFAETAPWGMVTDAGTVLLPNWMMREQPWHHRPVP